MSDSRADTSSRAVEERPRGEEDRPKSSSSRRESSSRHGSSRRDSERRHDEHRERTSHSHRDDRRREDRKEGSRQDHDKERRRREDLDDRHRSGSSSKRHRNDDDHESKRSRRHRDEDERHRSFREGPRRAGKDNREHRLSSHRHRDFRESSARDRKEPPPPRSRFRSRSPPLPASTSRQRPPTFPPTSTANHAGEEVDQDAPNFGPSGLLAAESNTVNGVALKYHEPPEARKPKHPWRLYCFKDAKQNEVLHLAAQSAYLLGRDRTVVDIPLDHESCSKQHAVLQFRQTITTNEFGDKAKRIQPFLIDLESSNGSYVNDNEIPTSRYYQLKSGDTLTFGASTREYVLLDESAA